MTASWLQQQVHLHIVAPVGTVVSGEAAHPWYVHAQQDGKHHEQGRQAPACPQPDCHEVIVIVSPSGAGPMAHSPNLVRFLRQNETASSNQPAKMTCPGNRFHFRSRDRTFREHFLSGSS